MVSQLFYFLIYLPVDMDCIMPEVSVLPGKILLELSMAKQEMNLRDKFIFGLYCQNSFHDKSVYKEQYDCLYGRIVFFMLRLRKNI